MKKIILSGAYGTEYLYRLQREILVSPFWFLKIKTSQNVQYPFMSALAALPWWFLNLFVWTLIFAPTLFDFKEPYTSNFFCFSWVAIGYLLYILIFGVPYFEKIRNDIKADDLNRKAKEVEDILEAKANLKQAKELGIFAILVLIIYAFGSLIYQIYYWLQNNSWFDLSVIALLIRMDSKEFSWALYPESWLGLHKLLTYTPSAIVALFLAFLIGKSLD